jgi:hypothetical protein
LAEALPRPVETLPPGTRRRAARYPPTIVLDGADPVNDEKKDKAPPAVHPKPPERDLEQELKRNPDDPNLKADVGSDESMDASRSLAGKTSRRRRLDFQNRNYGTVTKTHRRCNKSTIHRFERLGQFLA